MFGDLNKVQLIGNVTKDPDLRFTPGGAAVISFGLATNRNYKVGEEWKEEVSFHNIVIWRNAESLAKRIKKGTRIYIEGRLHTRSWDDAEGKKQYKTEITADSVILLARYEGASEGSGGGESSNQPQESDSSSNSSDDVIDPNDLPF